MVIGKKSTSHIHSSKCVVWFQISPSLKGKPAINCCLTALSYSLTPSFSFCPSSLWFVQTCSSPLSITFLSQVHWLRKQSLLHPNKILDERQSMSFPGKRTHAIVPGLKPFSEYRLTVNVFNKKGNGPNSDPVTFNTPEGGEVTDIQHTTYGCSSYT